MDKNPPSINENRNDKRIFKYKYFKLLIATLLAGVVISISINLQNTNTSVNALSNNIATMATSLSSANAKSDSKSIVNNTFPLGSGNATIYHKFQNPVQACWYYAATYRTQHPYTILWEKFSDEEKLKIRAIASKGIWKAYTCRRDNEVDLEKIEDLLIKGDASISKDTIEKIKKDAKAYKSVYDIRDLIGENTKIGEVIKPIQNSEKNENEIRELLEKGYTKDDGTKEHAAKNIDKIMQAISDNKKLDEIKKKIKDNINEFSIIRLIVKPDTIVKLIGEETINNRLEAKFYIKEDIDYISEKIGENKNKEEIIELVLKLEENENKIRELLEEGETKNIDDVIQRIRDGSNYRHIADTVATYYSTLHFDNEGKITHRRVKNSSDYKCIFPDSFDEKALFLSDESCTKIKKSKHNPDNSDSKEYKNEVEILDVSPMIKTSSKESKENNKALKFYLEERKELHQNLTNDGCGTISVEPDFVTGDLLTGELETPSLVFLCHKNNNRSHVRVMVRETQQETKEREEKRRQEVKKKAENGQSSEKQHKGSFLHKYFFIF